MRLFEPVDRHVAAIDPVPPRRRCENDDVRNFLGGAEAAHRKAVADIVGIVLRMGEAVAIPAIAVDQDGAAACAARPPAFLEVYRGWPPTPRERRLSEAVIAALSVSPATLTATGSLPTNREDNYG